MLFSSPFFCPVDTTSILFFRRHCVVAFFNHHLASSKIMIFFMIVYLTGVLCPFAQVPFALSSLAYLLNRSASRICSCLFLFLNGVLSTLFIFVVLFLSNLLNLSRFLGFTSLSKKQLSSTSPLSFPLSLRCHSRSRDEILS